MWDVRQTGMFSYQAGICKLGCSERLGRDRERCCTYAKQVTTESTEEFLRADSYSLWLRITCFQIHSLEWQIPVRVENLEAPLLLALVGFLIRKQLLL